MEELQLMEAIARVRRRQHEILSAPFIEIAGKGIKVKRGGFKNGKARSLLLEWHENGEELERLLTKMKEQYPERHQEMQEILEDVNQGIRVFCRTCLRISWRCSICPHCASEMDLGKSA